MQNSIHINSKQAQHFSLYCRHLWAIEGAVVLVHGLLCSRLDMAHFAEELVLRGFTVLAPATWCTANDVNRFNHGKLTPWNALRCLESHRKLGKNWDKADHLQSFFAKQILLSIWIRNADSEDTDVYTVTAEQKCQITMGFSCGAHEDFSKRSWGLSG